MRNLRATPRRLLLPLVGLLACSSPESTPPRAAAREAPPEPSAEELEELYPRGPAPTLPSAEPSRIPRPSGTTTGLPPSEGRSLEAQSADLQARGAAIGGDVGMALGVLGEALEAASEAEGDSACEQAYNSSAAVSERYETRSGMSVRAMPPRDEFMAMCEGLPPEAQRCMLMSYAIAHTAACRDLMQSAEIRERMAQIPRPAAR